MKTTITHVPLVRLVTMYADDRNSELEIGGELRPGTLRHYREVVRAFSLFLDRPATTEDLSPETINRFLQKLHSIGRSPYGVKNRRTGLLVLYRFAKREGMAEGDPARVRRIRCPRLDVDGYSVDQMQKLLAAFGGRQGRIQRCGLDQRIYYLSMLITLWDTGLRIGDIPAIRVDKFKPEGLLWAHEHKTGKTRWRRLSASGAELIAACIALDSDRECIWPGHNAKSLARSVNRIIRASGIPGTTRWIRRGSSSEVDRRHPGQGWRFLAHSTPAVFENHYRVPSIADDGAIAPPQLVIG